MATGPIQQSTAPDQAGDTKAKLLDALARRYGRALSRFFERRVAHRADVPDLVQDVFLRLARLRDFDAVQKPEHYIFATAASALKDRARHDAVRHAAAHDTFDEMAHAGSDFAPQRVLEDRETLARLQATLRRLPDRTRDVFVLRAFEGLKMVDVARAMGISTRAAEKHYAKALATIARNLEGWDER